MASTWEKYLLWHEKIRGLTHYLNQRHQQPCSGSHKQKMGNLHVFSGYYLRNIAEHEAQENAAITTWIRLFCISRSPSTELRILRTYIMETRLDTSVRRPRL
ncbi:hypothetical protein RB213_007081 [Colletotrichum asianum]